MTVVDVVDAETRLTTEESAQLAAAERVIAAGMGTFVEVGSALLEIRDRGLYKAHGTFADYCRDRWSLAESTAYKQIDAAQVVDAITSTIVEVSPPATEWLARELVPVWRTLGDAAAAEAWAGVVAECEAEGVPVIGKRVYAYIRREHRDLFKAGATYGRPPPMVELLSVLDDYIVLAEKLKRFSARNPDYQPPGRVALRYQARLELIETLTHVASQIADGSAIPSEWIADLDTRPLT